MSGDQNVPFVASQIHRPPFFVRRHGAKRGIDSRLARDIARGTATRSKQGFAPQPHELRARNIGHVILNTTQDRPWSQYFCRMAMARRDFVRKNPVATKRALRAFLKAADICANNPARAARFMVDKGFEPNFDRALEILSELPYRR